MIRQVRIPDNRRNLVFGGWVVIQKNFRQAMIKAFCTKVECTSSMFALWVEAAKANVERFAVVVGIGRAVLETLFDGRTKVETAVNSDMNLITNIWNYILPEL